MALSLTLVGAPVLRPGGWDDATLVVAGGAISGVPEGRRVDLTGYRVLPGIVDAHGDGFERHVAPRRGALEAIEPGLWAAAAELGACGITTGVVAQFWSWEGGMRGAEFARRVLASVADLRGRVATDLRSQLRLETHLIDDYEAVAEAVAAHGVDYLVFNDHLPHDRLAAGRAPKQYVGQALKSGRSPEAHLALMTALHARDAEVPAAVAALAARLRAAGVVLGSHDDATPESRADWRGRGARISEFPETRAAAEAARAGGDGIVLGAPNVMRGGSHKGNVSAADLVADGLCDALASDYHYPSLLAAALKVAAARGGDLAASWGLVSEGPARLLGLTDRGRIAPGLRADLVILDAGNRVAATIAGGVVSYMAGPVAERFLLR